MVNGIKGLWLCDTWSTCERKDFVTSGWISAETSSNVYASQSGARLARMHADNNDGSCVGACGAPTQPGDWRDGPARDDDHADRNGVT
jgi:hypothetical protein